MVVLKGSGRHGRGGGGREGHTGDRWVKGVHDDPRMRDESWPRGPDSRDPQGGATLPPPTKSVHARVSSLSPLVPLSKLGFTGPRQERQGHPDRQRQCVASRPGKDPSPDARRSRARRRKRRGGVKQLPQASGLPGLSTLQAVGFQDAPRP